MTKIIIKIAFLIILLTYFNSGKAVIINEDKFTLQWTITDSEFVEFTFSTKVTGTDNIYSAFAFSDDQLMVFLFSACISIKFYTFKTFFNHLRMMIVLVSVQLLMG